jgi:serine/threonine-protein kinase
VVGLPYEQAAGTLQGAGFAVARRDVESNEPKGVVVQMDPEANTLASKGATITVYVSKGPKESVVPDVTSFSREDAVATLLNSHFKADVIVVDVTDPSQDGVVLTQSPGPGETAKPGATVSITVGRYTPPPPPIDTTTLPPTDTTATDTTPVNP